MSATLDTIRFNGMLDQLPEDPKARVEHNRAINMLEFLTNAVGDAIKKDDYNPVYSALSDLAREAEKGRLQRAA